MLLRTTLTSPFGRKIRIAIGRLGLTDQVEIANTNYLDPEDPLRRDNPLGKMPVLVTEEAGALYDSPVILEFLNAIAAGNLLPDAGPARWNALRLQALADGVMDAGVAIVMESRMREEPKRCGNWIIFQKEKIERGLAAAAAMDLNDSIDVGTISLACALGFIEFRKQAEWRQHTALVQWRDRFSAMAPEYEATRPLLP